jgi:hypothetical protein
MAIERYVRVKGLDGEATAMPGTAYRSFDSKLRTVRLEASCDLNIADWDKFVAETNTLLGRDKDESS